MDLVGDGSEPIKEERKVKTEIFNDGSKLIKEERKDETELYNSTLCIKEEVKIYYGKTNFRTGNLMKQSKGGTSSGFAQRSTAGTVALTPKPATKAEVPKEQALRHATQCVKRSITPRGYSAPVAKPKVMGSRHKNYVKPVSERLIAVFPSNYPEVKLTMERFEILKDLIVERLDDLIAMEGNYNPQFNGVSLRMGGCVLSCNNDSTRTWLTEIIPSIVIEEGLSLQIGEVGILLQQVKVGAFFPGKPVTKELLLKRLRMQNRGIADMDCWCVHHMRQHKKGFYASIKVPETSISNLMERDMQVGFGLYCVTLRVLRNNLASSTAPTPLTRSASTSKGGLEAMRGGWADLKRAAKAVPDGSTSFSASSEVSSCSDSKDS